MLERKTPLKRTPLKPGKALKSGGQLKTKTQLKRTEMKPGKPLKRTAMKSGTPLKRTAIKAKAPEKISPIRKSAEGQQCMVRVPGVCRGGTETTVLAHLNGAGMGGKAHDICGAYACSDCHAWLDGGYAKNSTRDERDLLHLQGVIRTQPILMDLGFIVVSGAA